MQHSNNTPIHVKTIDLHEKVYYRMLIPHSTQPNHPGKVKARGGAPTTESADVIPAGQGSRAFAGQTQYRAAEAGPGYRGGIHDDLRNSHILHGDRQPAHPYNNCGGCLPWTTENT